MARSTVQPNLNITDLLERFGTDEKCRTALTKLRWPDGVHCPRCKGPHISNRPECVQPVPIALCHLLPLS
jgi:hypothetical protein